ncbi:hypothetical protein QYF61_007924 [Mycteria americana]|uniref:Uncharacterized protein n=1 Tax=Mycteria americana TaxID=33587 RepID=A0AAN7RXN9_MYCAM|nr:hypothetical protein QYF61_007924 [Mycteria americana]
MVGWRVRGLCWMLFRIAHLRDHWHSRHQGKETLSCSDRVPLTLEGHRKGEKRVNSQQRGWYREVEGLGFEELYEYIQDEGLDVAALGKGPVEENSGKIFIPKEKPIETRTEEKVTLDPELEEALASASDTELYDLAG